MQPCPLPQSMRFYYHKPDRNREWTVAQEMAFYITSNYHHKFGASSMMSHYHAHNV